jgi:deoxycytidylate deaminase
MVDSYPCSNCLNLIINLNIKRIVFSSNNNNIISADPRTLIPIHVSAGAKYLKNINKENEIQNSKNKNNCHNPNKLKQIKTN